VCKNEESSTEETLQRTETPSYNMHHTIIFTMP